MESLEQRSFKPCYLVHWWKVVALCLVLLAQPLFSQESTLSQEGDLGPGGYLIDSEIGIHVGNVLPNDIVGVSEIIPVWGGQVSKRWGRSFIEVGGLHGRELGVKWTNAHVGLRIDMPINSLIIFSQFGVDYIYYSDVDGGEHDLGSGHIGGGVLTQVADNLWFRIGLKFNIRPGTSLYFGGGFTFRLEKLPELSKEEKEEQEKIEEEEKENS